MRKEGSPANEKEIIKEKRLSDSAVNVSVSFTRKRSEEPQSNSEKKRKCSSTRGISPSKRLIEETPYIRVEKEEESVRQAAEDVDVSVKSLPGDTKSTEVETAPTLKMEVAG